MKLFVFTHFTYDGQAADKNEITHKEVSLCATFLSLFVFGRRQQIDDGVTE